MKQRDHSALSNTNFFWLLHNLAQLILSHINAKEFNATAEATKPWTTGEIGAFYDENRY